MNKTKFLYVRVEENDLELFQRAADFSGLKLSKFIRQAVRERSKEILNNEGVINRGQKTENAGSTET